MLAELRMELKIENEDFGYYQSSNMQGVLMESINSDYAELLHHQKLNPYSQYLDTRNKKFWVIKTLDQEAYKYIIDPLLEDSLSELYIEKKDIKIQIIDKKLHTFSKSELLERFYKTEGNRYLNLEFLSPTAFKSGGKYVFWPDLKLIYQSLMNKYSATCSDMEMFDEDTLNALVENSDIVKYKIHSTYFPLEGIKIPAFKGTICIRINGTRTMANYARFLAEFGEYSGVGIKTGIGMGAMRITDRRNSNER